MPGEMRLHLLAFLLHMLTDKCSDTRDALELLCHSHKSRTRMTSEQHDSCPGIVRMAASKQGNAKERYIWGPE